VASSAPGENDKKPVITEDTEKTPQEVSVSSVLSVTTAFSQMGRLRQLWPYCMYKLSNFPTPGLFSDPEDGALLGFHLTFGRSGLGADLVLDRYV